MGAIDTSALATARDDVPTDGPSYVATVLPLLEYAFQPIVDSNTGVVYAYEALLRRTDKLGFAGPREFFHDAHARGVLSELEPALLDMALTAMSKFVTAADTRLFFNLDGRGIGNENDRRLRLQEVLTSKGISVSKVCLELSPYYQDNNPESQDLALNTLRQAGFSFCLDDFGKGFSELRLLHDLMPDYVKVDQFFLTDIDKDPRRKIFVATVTNLAHALGARVIAEGVETEQQYRTCRDAGCDLIQGYYVATPFTRKQQARLFYEHIRTPTLQGRTVSNEDSIRNELTDIPTINYDATLSELLNLFYNQQNTAVVAVLDVNREPRGLIHERDLKGYLYAGAFSEKDYNDALNLPLRSFVRTCPIADIYSDMNHLLETFTSSLSSDGLIITRDYRYVGFLSATAMLKIINERRLEEAQDQNPLTRLPGNGAISRFIASAADKKAVNRHFCYFDFDNFKPFNDTYGYRQGDRAIILFSELLRRHLMSKDTFFGHIGGDDFFAGFLGGDQTDVAWQLLTLKRAFKTDVESFYDPQHRDLGYIEANDRFGGIRRFPLLDCSISIATLPAGDTMAPEDITRALTDLKRDAKRSDDGLIAHYLGQDLTNLSA